MRRRLPEVDEDLRNGPRWLEVCAGVPDSVAVYAGGSLIGFSEAAVHEYLARFGDDCGAECRAAGHLVLI